MPPVLELVMSLLGGGDTLDKLASLTGADDAAQASDAARLSAPAILGGLAERTQEESGLETVMGMLDDNRPVLDDLGGFLDKAETEAGNTVLDFLFAGDRADLVSGLAAKAELGGSVIGKLLPMLAPAVAAVVANERNLQELDGPGLAAMLNSETAAMDRDGILYAVTDFPPPNAVTAGVAAMAGAAGIESIGSGPVASASGTVGDGLDGVAGAVDSAGDAAGGAIGNAGDAAAGAVGSAGDAAGDAAGSVGSAAAGAAAGVADKAGDVLGGAAGAVGGAAEGVTDSVADAAGAAAEKAGEAKEAVTAGVKGAFGGGDGDGEGSDLGWLWWAIGAVALVLLLAWLLSQCNDEDAASSSTNTTEVSVDADDDSAESDSSADSDADSESEDADDTDGDAASGLQEQVDGALRGTGVVGAVSDGEVTLTGTVEDSDASDQAEAAVAAIEGVESVDNQIEVDGSDSSSSGSDSDGAADLDAGDTINELLDLDPVTFRVSSATITDAGTAVLDEAAAFLEDNGDLEIEIGGHTDSDGATAENLDLSERRAEAVKVYLEGKGIDGDRMTTRGYGESEPKVPNTSAEGKAENRRIEFTVL